MTDQGVSNPRVQQALALWGAEKNNRTFANVLRTCVLGDLLLDTTDSAFADPQHPFAAGDRLAIADQVDNAGKRLLLAYTVHERLAARRGAPGRSLVQPAASVISMAIQRYEGIAIDAGHPDVFIAYRPELVQQLTEQPEANADLARMAAERSAPFEQFLAALGGQRTLYVPFVDHRDEAGDSIGRSALTTTLRDGGVCGVAGTSPAELWAWAPDAGVMPTTWDRLCRVALEDGQAGIVIDPAEAGIIVSAAQLR